jgi:ribonucleoside-diphosphate reductase beta chain
MVFRATNWNRPEDGYTADIWNTNFLQIWSEEDFTLADDINTWNELTPAQQKVYKRVLAMLTVLDTEQGGEGMPLIMRHVKGLQRKAVLALMCFMEHVHARSYSFIFMTLEKNSDEIDKVIEEAETNPLIQFKAAFVSKYYNNIHSQKDLYLAMVASVFLESFLFYSGFYYPLYLVGQGKMTHAGDVIKAILRDEPVHGSYIGVLAQETFDNLSPVDKLDAEEEVVSMLKLLYENELLYTKEVYEELSLVDEVSAYIRYNANRALLNLGLEPYFEEEEINPVVLNGINNETSNADFFSLKPEYTKARKVERLDDKDFEFEWLDNKAQIPS